MGIYYCVGMSQRLENVYQGIKATPKMHVATLNFVLFTLTSLSAFSQNSLDSLSSLYKTSSGNTKAKINNALGYEFMLNGNEQMSISHYKESLGYYVANGDVVEEAGVLKNIGETYRSKDKPHLAIEYFLRAARIFEKKGKNNEIVDIYNKMTELFMRQSDIISAESYSKKVKGILDVSPNPAGKAKWLNTKGRIFNNYQKYDSAILCYKKSIALFDSLELYHGKGRAMHNMANSLRESGQLDSALSLSKKVLEIREINENVKSKIFTLLLVADIYNDMGEYRKAIPYSLDGLRLAQEHDFMDRRRVALLYLSRSYEMLLHYDSAMYYHKWYAEVMDTVFNVNIFEKTAQMKMVYETEKKEQTIALQASNLELQKSRTNVLIITAVFVLLSGVILLIAFIGKTRSNKVLLDQKQEIERQNNEREILLKEIHHRVKNNLQIISSLLSLQSRKMEDGEAKDAVREGQSRIKSMSLIHQKLYGESNFSKINMKEYIEDLTEILFKSYKPGSMIEKKIEVDNLFIDVDTAVPLGLILNELISNALKYAFQDNPNGELDICMSRKDGKLFLKVADTGKGLPENFKENKSMGMNLVYILGEQLDAQIEVDNSKGTAFIIQLTDKVAA